MRNINIETLGVDHLGDSLFLFGKVQWKTTEDEDQDPSMTMKIVFDGFPCRATTVLLKLLKNIDIPKSDLIEIPGLYINYEGMEKSVLITAVKEIFSIAMVSVPSEFRSIDNSFKEEWEEA